MQRNITLSKGAHLWYEGDRAVNIAAVEKGKLVVKSPSGLMGLAIPGTVIGEGAFLTLDDEEPLRTATVVALEDDTVVQEHSVERVKGMMDSGNPAVAHQVLVTLMIQTCRNALVVNASNLDRSTITLTLNGLLQGLMQSAAKLKSTTDWKDFMAAFRFLHAIRNASQQLREDFSEGATQETLDQANDEALKYFHGEDILPMVEEYIRAEKDKAKWLETS